MNANDAVSEAIDITQLKTKFEGYLENGEYLPLGAWVVRGYDPALIVANAGPDDIRENRMAGKCYRVGVESTSSGTTRQNVEAHNLRVNARPKAKAKALAGAVEPQLALEDGDVDADSTSSNSSSSSSSDRRKKRAKKGKKQSKKDKKHGKGKKDKKKDKKRRKTPNEDIYGLPQLCQSSATESLI